MENTCLFYRFYFFFFFSLCGQLGRQSWRDFFHYFNLLGVFHFSVSWWFLTLAIIIIVVVVVVVLLIWEIFLSALANGLPLESEWQQISASLLDSFCILADLSITVIWMVSIPFLIFKTSSPCTCHLVTVPSVPITIGITVTFMFYSLFFFQFSSRSEYWSFFPVSCSFTLWTAGTVSPLFGRFSFLFFFVWGGVCDYH